jgi:predicted dinucleotide-binding enzyme
VIFGSRRPDSAEIKELLERAGPHASAAPSAEAVAPADVVLLATPWNATEQVLSAAGDLSGKILIDATNPLKPDLSGLTTAPGDSGGQQVARWAARAKVVKAFNTIGFNIMANPRFGENAAVLLYCGDDDRAKEIVRGLAEELGFEPLDAGPLRQSGLLEHAAVLWISIAIAKGREFAFHFVRR